MSSLFAQVLAKKMTVLYKLAREQLSKQSHYDFGLRALKSVLVMAGELKRGSANLSEVDTRGHLSCFILGYSKLLFTDIHYETNDIFICDSSFKD